MFSITDSSSKCQETYLRENSKSCNSSCSQESVPKKVCVLVAKNQVGNDKLWTTTTKPIVFCTIDCWTIDFSIPTLGDYFFNASNKRTPQNKRESQGYELVRLCGKLALLSLAQEPGFLQALLSVRSWERDERIIRISVCRRPVCTDIHTTTTAQDQQDQLLRLPLWARALTIISESMPRGLG